MIAPSNPAEVGGYVLVPREPTAAMKKAEMQSGRQARFRFKQVQPCGNPDDMFFGSVEFVEFAGAPDDEAHPMTYRHPRRATLRQVFIAAAVLIALLVLVTVSWNGRVGGWW